MTPAQISSGVREILNTLQNRKNWITTRAISPLSNAWCGKRTAAEIRAPRRIKKSNREILNP